MNTTLVICWLDARSTLLPATNYTEQRQLVSHILFDKWSIGRQVIYVHKPVMYRVGPRVVDATYSATASVEKRGHPEQAATIATKDAVNCLLERERERERRSGQETQRASRRSAIAVCRDIPLPSKSCATVRMCMPVLADTLLAYSRRIYRIEWFVHYVQSVTKILLLLDS